MLYGLLCFLHSLVCLTISSSTTHTHACARTHTHTHTHTVSPEGSVSVEPTSVVLTRFDNRTFTCTSQGGPNNTYQWQKDGVDLANQTSPLLDVTDVNATDGGVYTCVVTNAAGNESFDSSLYIAPYIVLHPVMDILSANGSNVTFECEAESFPPPEYVWEMSGSESNYASTVQSDGQFLNFEPVEFGDEGYYRCLAYISINITNHTAASQAGLLTSKERFVCTSIIQRNTVTLHSLLRTCM